MVVLPALVDGGFCGRNQFRTHHTLAIPRRSTIDSDASALGRGGISRVDIVRADVDVVGGCPRSVDVVLVGADLVFPRPLSDFCGGVLGEAAVPDDFGHAGACQQGGGEGDGVEVHVDFCSMWLTKEWQLRGQLVKLERRKRTKRDRRRYDGQELLEGRKEQDTHREQRTSLYHPARHVAMLIVQSIRRLDCGFGRTIGFDILSIPCSTR
jgi:hypothetical protein